MTEITESQQAQWDDEFVDKVLHMFRALREAMERLHLVPFGARYMLFPGFHYASERKLFDLAETKIYDGRSFGAEYLSIDRKHLFAPCAMEEIYTSMVRMWIQSEAVDALTDEDCEYIVDASYPEALRIKSVSREEVCGGDDDWFERWLAGEESIPGRG